MTCVVRLARYQSLNMDQVVGQARATHERLAASGELAGRHVVVTRSRRSS